MDDNIVLKSAIAFGVGDVPQEHTHTTRLTTVVGNHLAFVSKIPRNHAEDVLSWGSKVGIIDTGRVLDRDRDTVISTTALVEVVVLEVEGCGFRLIMQSQSIVCITLTSLGETVLVRDIMNGVNKVEGVGTSSVEVVLNGGSLVRVLGEDEVKARGRLGGRCCLGTLKGNSIVATADSG